jgi:hypothetical protein
MPQTAHYDDLRQQVDSGQNGARSHDATPARRRSSVRGTGPRSCAYEGWTVTELKKRAKQLGISGYSGLNKDKPIILIRSH